MSVNEAYKLISEKLNGWLQEIVRILPNIALAAVVLVIGLFIAKLIHKFVAKLLKKIIRNQTLDKLLDSTIYLILIGIVVFVALNILKLDKAVTSILAGAGILGLALAFAFQDIAANFMSGIFISFRKPLSVGDTVRIKDYTGKVEEINLRDTVIRTFQGLIVIIPNKDVFQNPIENISMWGRRRIDLTIGVSYGDDLEKVKEVTLNALKSLSDMPADEEPTLFYTEFGDSSINFEVRIWVETIDQMAYLRARNDAIICIKKAYDENNISIPFPTRTLDFGIKGGKELSEMKLNVTEDNKV